MELRECLRLIYERVSIRKYKPDPVPDELILELLKAGNAAPSAGNLQARDFIVVKNPETKKKIAKAALEQMFIASAPVVIVVCANYPRSMRIYGERGKLYAEQDATAAVENILLAAHALGLGAVWVGAFYENAVSKILDLPEFVRPIAIIPVGWPDEKPAKRSRYPVEELTHWERW